MKDSSFPGPTGSPYIPCVCPIKRHLLFKVVRDGIEVKCRGCRLVVFISRESLEKQRIEFSKDQVLSGVLSPHNLPAKQTD
jgi:hypothetical protein